MATPQSYVLTLVITPDSGNFDDALLASITACTQVKELHTLAEGIAFDIRDIPASPSLREQLQALLNPHPVDWCLQPETGRRKKLLISDMDSTIIGQECIDELAAHAGIGEHVAAITERAMRGELDFAASLRERVALLKGLPASLIQTVLKERITLNAGARALVRTMRKGGAYTMLVSGGFTAFSETVARLAGFEAHHANSLEIAEDVLLGKVTPPILDKQSKRRLLEAALREKGLQPSESLAVGDGANDADMISTAGLGVAYRAKPFLQDLADASVTYTDLTTPLYFQGYRAEEIIRD